MEYLIWLGFFGGGWVLSKLDSRARMKPMLQQLATEVAQTFFMEGMNHVKAELVAAEEADENEQETKAQMGFDLFMDKEN